MDILVKYIMKKGTAHQDNIIVLNVNASSNIVSKYFKGIINIHP